MLITTVDVRRGHVFLADGIPETAIQQSCRGQVLRSSKKLAVQTTLTRIIYAIEPSVYKTVSISWIIGVKHLFYFVSWDIRVDLCQITHEEVSQQGNS